MGLQAIVVHSAMELAIRPLAASIARAMWSAGDALKKPGAGSRVGPKARRSAVG